MRGKGILIRAIGARHGITPAHAGKSALHLFCLRITQDHPRLCGEKYPGTHLTRYLVGSPPPMRGKGTQRYQGQIVPRITPAHAGKSIGVQAGKIVTWDHPRPCGEKVTQAPDRA